MSTHASKPLTIHAEQWNGTNVAEITALAGAENVHHTEEILQVKNAGNRWAQVHRGWWVSKVAGTGELTVHADDSFRRFFE